MDQIMQIMPFLIDNGARLVSALAILVVGWIVAGVLAGGARQLLRRTNASTRLAGLLGQSPTQTQEAEKWAGNLVFYIIMLFVLVGFFQALNLTIITEPLNRLLIPIFEYAPRLLGAGLLLLLAWALATIARLVIRKGLDSTKLDERLGGSATLSQTLSESAYWLILLLFLPGILDALQMNGLLGPVQVMLNQILGFLPNLVAAGVILLVGWFFARIVQRIVSNLLALAGLDALSERVGLAKVLGAQKLSGLLGMVVYVFIFIPVITAALNALAIDSVTRPVSNMLDTVLKTLPLIFAAIVVVALAYVVGQVVSGLVENLLAGFGFNNVLVWLGLGKEPAEGERTPSQIAGAVTMTAFMLFAAIQATELLGFTVLNDLVTQFTLFASQLIAGVLIFGVGLYLSNLAASAIQKSQAAQASLLAVVARVAILILSGSMALRQMGLATDIINLAFSLTLGAITIAAALAFGLGGRDVAGQLLSEWTKSLRTEKK